VSRERLVALVLLATLGGCLLAVVMFTYWTGAGDNLAYWLAAQHLAAGQPVYTASDIAFEPYTYHYPPPLAQILVPLTVVLPTVGYLTLYRALELLATWELAGRRMLPMLALIAFLPVAIELRFDNVNLFMALGILLGLGRWPWLFSVGAVVMISHGLGIVYLALRRRWLDAAIAALAGALIAGVSVAIAPDLWRSWLDAVTGRVDIIGNSLLPVPFLVRAGLGLVVTIAGGLVGARRGELLLVAGITIANPNLAVNGLAVLAAAVPIWFAGPDGIGTARERAANGAVRAVRSAS